MTFDEFARSRLGPLLRFATVLCGERGLAEDVVQEALARAYRGWTDIEHLDRPEAYVRKMILNEYLSWRRKWARMVPHAEVEPAGEVPDHATGQADRQLLTEELAKLPRRQRAVLVLRYFCGLSDPEMAEIFGCRPSTVRAHAARALAALRVEMQAELTLAKEE